MLSLLSHSAGLVLHAPLHALHASNCTLALHA